MFGAQTYADGPRLRSWLLIGAFSRSAALLETARLFQEIRRLLCLSDLLEAQLRSESLPVGTFLLSQTTREEYGHLAKITLTSWDSGRELIRTRLCRSLP